MNPLEKEIKELAAQVADIAEAVRPSSDRDERDLRLDGIDTFHQRSSPCQYCRHLSLMKVIVRGTITYESGKKVETQSSVAIRSQCLLRNTTETDDFFPQNVLSCTQQENLK